MNQQLITEMDELQMNQGFITKEQISELAQKYSETEAKIESIITFYARFTKKEIVNEQEQKVEICLGNSCMVCGGKKLFDQLKAASATQKIDVSASKCMGICSLAPVVQIEDEILGNANLELIEKQLK
ncbi:MAG: NAD(P)H-dependent oxidoreductase subunit E [Mycoplasmatales bacterium]